MTDPLHAAWQALRRSAAGAGCSADLVAGSATPWWSATFAGHRLTLTIGVTRGSALDAWLTTLADADLPIPDRVVADCAIDRVSTATGGVRITLSMLLLDVEV